MLNESKEFQIYKFLRGRRKFSENEKNIFYRLQMGCEGEKMFSHLVKKQLKNNYLSINGLLLEHKGTLFQLDKLLIFQNQLYQFEVKYHQGEFELKDDFLYCFTMEKKYRNPLHQLKRSELNFRELLFNLGVSFDVKPYVVFVHPAFTLFHAQRHLPIILPTQINSFIERLNHTPDNLTKRHEKFAEKLRSIHIKESPYERYPKYDFDNLRKGVFCKDCRRMMYLIRRTFSCNRCSYKENMDSAVLRHVVEFNILFPEKKISTGIIHKWIAEMISIVTIRRVLSYYLKKISNGKYTYYDFSN